MIIVNKILYDDESREADIELKSDDICIMCYCHPAKNLKKIYESHNHNIVAFQAENVMVDNHTIPQAVKTTSGYYSYFLRGKVISATKIQINDFVIQIGAIPKDIEVGTYVSCSCLRLDYIINCIDEYD